MAGRVIVLTFEPVRFQSDLRAELEFRAFLSQLRERYRTEIDQITQVLGELQAR